jgi:hypothetical protein
MFYPGSESEHFLDPDPNMFSSRILHDKWNANLPVLFSSFLLFQEQSLSLCHSQKIRDPDKIHPGWIRIPDPGGKKAPDPQHCVVPVPL